MPNSLGLALIIAAIIALFVGLEYRWRRSLRREFDAMLERAKHPERYPPAEPDREPSLESRWIVRLSDLAVECEHPDGDIERIAWLDLQRVDVLCTSDGPFAPDQYWVLCADTPKVMIPWGATGGEELLERMQQLPNFDNEAIIKAASLTEDVVIPCWRKPPA